MIEANLGNAERVIRLLFGIGLLSWFALLPERAAVDWFAVAVASMLILNGIFSRCYLWFVLDLNTARRGSAAGSATRSCRA